MGQIRIVVDLPGDSMLRALHKEPFPGYDSEKFRRALEQRLKAEFPDAARIKVEIVATNMFFGIDVMGEEPEEVVDVQQRVSAVVKKVVGDLKR